ncbi:MAG: hypothetical protein SWE60_25690, partial [Thermodesulfobacteriota bacterium]|nr:hypothetical protein [Thermodesulfobacteriota bacterium]
IPRPRSTGDAHDYLADFALCFRCHNSNELLGTSDKTDASQTNFEYNNGDNGHFTHLVMGKTTGFDSDFDGVNDSDFTCTACHNVHGSSTPAMTRDGALIAASRTDLSPDFGALHFSYVGGATLVDSTGSQMVLGGGNATTNGMCNAACHSSSVTCYRTPYYAPRVMSCPDIEAVFNDGVDTTLVTAYVLDHEPGTVPAVTIDATAVGGSSGQPMYDDGATGGDLVAGDQVYTWETGTTVTGGSKRLDVTASDADGTGTNDVEVQVIDPDELILDNEDAAYTGTWPLVEGNACAYEDDFQWNEGGTGADTATWTPTIYQAGDYEVYAWWVDHTNRATDAPYTINYDGGSVTLDVDCTTNGCDWYLLGTYPFAVGTSGSIVLSDHANGYVIADAIRWLRQ